MVSGHQFVLNRATRHEHTAATRGPGMAGRPDGGVKHPGEARAPLRLEPGAPGGLVAVEAPGPRRAAPALGLA